MVLFALNRLANLFIKWPEDIKLKITIFIYNYLLLVDIIFFYFFQINSFKFLNYF